MKNKKRKRRRRTSRKKEMIQFQQPFQHVYTRIYIETHRHSLTYKYVENEREWEWEWERARSGGKFKSDLWQLTHWGLRAFIRNFDAMDKSKSISVQRKHGFDSVQNEMADGRLVLRRWSTQFGRGNGMKVKKGVSPPFLNFISFHFASTHESQTNN